jgi:hypothetical protein
VGINLGDGSSGGGGGGGGGGHAPGSHSSGRAQRGSDSGEGPASRLPAWASRLVGRGWSLLGLGAQGRAQYSALGTGGLLRKASKGPGVDTLPDATLPREGAATQGPAALGGLRRALGRLLRGPPSRQHSVDELTDDGMFD